MRIRIFFVLLVIAQIALLIAFYPQINSTIGYRAVEVELPPQQDGIRLSTVHGVDAPLSVEVTTNKIGAQACREIGNFAEKKSAEGVRRWLEARGIGGRIDTRVVISEQSYRVYLGGFKDEEEATFAQQVIQKRNPELKNALIYQTNANWRVSLAQLDTKQDAEEFKQNLENGIEGILVYIESRQNTKTSNSLRYVSKDAERLINLSKNNELIQLLGANKASIKNCS